MYMLRRRSMRRHRQVVCLAKGGDLQESANASATRDVGLKYVHGSRLQHAVKIEDVVPVFSGGYVHSRRRPVANHTKAFQVVGRDRLFEPAHSVVMREDLRLRERQLATVGSVGIDEETSVRSNRVASYSHPLDVPLGIASDFHFHKLDPLRCPASELLRKPFIRVAREAAAAINRNSFVDLAQQGYKRK